jgi:hypothetical protein
MAWSERAGVHRSRYGRPESELSPSEKTNLLAGRIGSVVYCQSEPAARNIREAETARPFLPEDSRTELVDAHVDRPPAVNRDLFALKRNILSLP